MKSRFLLMLAALVLLAGCAQVDADTGIGLDDSHPLFVYFTDSFPDKEALWSLVGDCNDDGIEDLVIVYRESKSANHLVTVYSDGAGYRITEPIPAPVENCLLQWRDIDERPPVELSVSGQKGIHIGYAIYRFTDGEWISLYGDSMDSCC